MTTRINSYDRDAQQFYVIKEKLTAPQQEENLTPIFPTHIQTTYIDPTSGLYERQTPISSDFWSLVAAHLSQSNALALASDQQDPHLFFPNRREIHIHTNNDLVHLLAVLDLCKTQKISPQIKSLSIEYYLHETDGRTSNLFNQIMQTLYQDLENKTPIELKYCRHVTDALAEDIVLNQSATQILNLNWQDNHDQLTDAGLASIAEKCEDLSQLNVSGHSSITDQGVLSLVHNRITTLQAIDLDGTKVSDIGITALAEICTNLQSISLNGCKKITVSGLKTLIQKCPKLYSMKIKQCPQIARHEIEELRNLRFGLQLSFTDLPANQTPNPNPL